MLKLLIVDSNAVLAKRIASKIENHLHNVNIDYARNPMILKARLHSKYYDLILADILSMSDPIFTRTLLDSVSCPVIIWSVLGCKDCPHRSGDEISCNRNNCPLRTSSDCPLRVTNIQQRFVTKPTDCNVETVINVIKDPSTKIFNLNEVFNNK